MHGATWIQDRRLVVSQSGRLRLRLSGEWCGWKGPGKREHEHPDLIGVLPSFGG
jgi:hypothetical protein